MAICKWCEECGAMNWKSWEPPWNLQQIALTLCLGWRNLPLLQPETQNLGCKAGQNAPKRCSKYRKNAIKCLVLATFLKFPCFLGVPLAWHGKYCFWQPVKIRSNRKTTAVPCWCVRDAANIRKGACDRRRGPKTSFWSAGTTFSLTRDACALKLSRTRSRRNRRKIYTPRDAIIPPSAIYCNKKIKLLPAGFEPGTTRSWIRRSDH